MFQFTGLALPKAPSESAFSLQDLNQEAQQQQEQKNKAKVIKQAWAKQLKQMQAAFRKVTAYEKQDTSPDLKVKARLPKRQSLQRENHPSQTCPQ